MNEAAKLTKNQHEQPGRQDRMDPQPLSIRENYRGSGKLEGRVAIITGGDSGIGRAVALHFTREGAKVAIVFLEEHDDARKTRELVEADGGECLLVQADLREVEAAASAVQQVVDHYGTLDVLVNNIAQQHPVEKPEDLDPKQIEDTFRSNVFSYYYMTLAALPHLGEGAAIVNTSSVTGAQGHKKLLDYAATKGAVDIMTLSLAKALVDRGIRVNAVAPGPVWTPLIPASFSAEEVESFGKSTPMGRPAQPSEIAPAYVYLASEDASYVTGHVLHVNGGSFMAA